MRTQVDLYQLTGVKVDINSEGNVVLVRTTSPKQEG
jgi:hypothetical protein